MLEPVSQSLPSELTCLVVSLTSKEADHRKPSEELINTVMYVMLTFRPEVRVSAPTPVF